MEMNDLHGHGILVEKSDYRAHVCFKEGFAYIFLTSNARAQCNEAKGWSKRDAFQEGVEGRTAIGYVVPPDSIEGCQRVKIPDDIILRVNCLQEESTSQRGKKAVEVIRSMLLLGMIPLASIPVLVTEKDIQISGVDIIVTSKLKIEVKCDYNGGKTKAWQKGLTGNLYLQIAERNPLKKF